MEHRDDGTAHEPRLRKPTPGSHPGLPYAALRAPESGILLVGFFEKRGVQWNTVTTAQLTNLVFEAQGLVMLLLSADVGLDARDLGSAYRKGGIAALPAEGVVAHQLLPEAR